EGFPGWHIECSAMAKKYLGTTFDIHGGGVDNIFPHNESEIAQSECANDVDFARYWILVGSLTVDGVKMSKSLGNFITIKDALKQYRPEVIRQFVYSAHYSSPVDYTADSLTAAAGGWERLYGAVRLTRQMQASAPASDDGNSILTRLEQAKQEFTAAMDDDFNTPKAIAALQELTRDVNTLLNSGTAIGRSTLDAIETTYQTLGGDVLGLIPAGDTASSDGQREAGLVELLISLRADARKQKDFATSDRIRDELKNLGVILEDRADGTVWRTN
ncbi:MAG TPA: DALR domain-containing protein, partial [Phototrophicaceae bacterium]|nr:DALR domain-containing protein [Phototrophicaceae bacterium]